MTQNIIKLMTLTALLTACSPVPRRTLNQEEKMADMLWIYSQFNDNYAPLELKSSLYKFNFETLKSDYLKKAEETKSNEDFYKVMFNFVAQFKDAHTSATLVNSSLPNRTMVAYLGFNGIRMGAALEVTSVLPTYSFNSDYPVKTGDQITKINGKTLGGYVQENLVIYRDLGLTEANTTYHMNKIFNRISTINGIPTEENAVITVKREGIEKEFDLILPWVKKDLVEFTREQKNASKSDDQDGLSKIFEAGQATLDLLKTTPMLDLMPAIFKTIDSRLPSFDFMNTFAFIDDFAALDSPALLKALGVGFENTLDELKNKRTVPASALFIDQAKTFPTYVFTAKNKLIAYMYLNTFSPAGADSVVVQQVQDTLAALQANGIQDIIIDMINNGGGSLQLGMKLAQTFSKTKLITPDMQFKLSETWIDRFEASSLNGKTDSERELAKRVYTALREDKAGGKLISRKMSIEELMPFALKGNTALEKKFNIVLLVNEMCASMCDIFSAVLKDNNMATIIGSTTMGAGGNVVNHTEAPNSHLQVRQTESLVVRPDGSYIENNGVKPDIAVAVFDSTKSKYDAVMLEAIKFLTLW